MNAMHDPPTTTAHTDVTCHRWDVGCRTIAQHDNPTNTDKRGATM